MAKFIWITGDAAFTIEAKDEDEAKRRAIANRISQRSDESEKDCVRGFFHFDTVYELGGNVTDEPYKGYIDDEGGDPFEDEEDCDYGDCCGECGPEARSDDREDFHSDG